VKPIILYEDNHVIVVVKPPMMPSQADASGDADMLSYIKSYIKEKYSKPGEVYAGLVHRLDRPTGGVMVFARTSKAAARLSAQVRDGLLGKEYLAVVEGNPKGAGTLTDYLLKDKAKNTVRTAKKGEKDSKYAELDYCVLAAREDRALVRVQLKTGRSHQIRVQFSSRGHALIGDARYGRGGCPLALFAAKLSFEHPTKHDIMEFTALPTGEAFKEFEKEIRENGYGRK